jgi:hypothetical protein
MKTELVLLKQPALTTISINSKGNCQNAKTAVIFYTSDAKLMEYCLLCHHHSFHSILKTEFFLKMETMKQRILHSSNKSP